MIETKQNIAIKSPRSSLLPHLPREQWASLTYRPDIMPGARDVATPQGIMRVNEWGKAGGRMVVFVCGASTPSPLWATIAHGMVSAGCRVITFDLWGRGYSDLPLTCALSSYYYGLQIKYALDSSRDFMSHPRGVTLVGYSLGGPIAADFAGSNPDLVDALVLMAPGGLQKVMPDGYNTLWFKYPWLASRSFRRKMVAKLLGLDLSKNRPKTPSLNRIKSLESLNLSEDPAWLPSEADFDALTQWQFDNHDGFVRAYFNTILDGPVINQTDTYSRVCDIISGKRQERTRLSNSRLLVCMGKQDSIFSPDAMKAAVLGYVTDSYVDFVEYDGGHDFPGTFGIEIVQEILEVWRKLDSSRSQTKTEGDEGEEDAAC